MVFQRTRANHGAHDAGAGGVDGGATPALPSGTVLPGPASLPDSTGAGAETRLDGVRIAMINWRDPWQAVAGGAEEYAWRISRHLLGRGADVTFVTSRERGQPRTETRDGVTFRRMGGKYTVYPLVLLWLMLHRRAFDTAMDCMNGIPFFARLILPRRVPVVCVVHHVHDLQFCAYFNRPMAWFGRFVEGPVASRVYRSCATVTVSESSKNAMRTKLGWRAPITVIHNGSSRLRPVDPVGAAEEPGLGEPAVVSLGRLVVQKRVARVVDIAKELHEDWPGLRVHIIGRGPEAEPLRARIERHGLTGRAHLHGFLPEAEKNAILAGALLHVTASEFEGWGLTVIEAAALGVPTVAYDVDGLRDSVCDGRTGWLVRPQESLAEAVDRALSELRDPARAAQVRRSCREWAGRFTWERSGRHMTALVAAQLPAATEAAGRARLPARRGTVSSTARAEHHPAQAQADPTHRPGATA